MKTATLQRLLATTTASLTLCFCAVAQAADKEATTPITFSTILQEGQTANSLRLFALVQKINKEKPAGTPRIVILDPDHIATWQLLGASDSNMSEVVEEYIRIRTGNKLDKEVLDAISASVASKSAETASPFAMKPDLTPAQMEKELCAVSPYNPGKSTSTYFSDVIMKAVIGGKDFDGLKGYKADLGLSTEDFKQQVDAHEVFHCLDNKYLVRKQQAKTVPEWVVAANQSETFAEIAGLLLRIKEGADISLIDKSAAGRILRFNLLDSLRAKSYTPEQKEFYEITKYYIHPGLSLLKDHVVKVGVQSIRGMSLTQIRDLAQELTDRTDFTWHKSLLLTNYLRQGAARIDEIVAGLSAPQTAERDRAFLRGVASDFSVVARKHLETAVPGKIAQAPNENSVREMALQSIVRKARESGGPLTPKTMYAARNGLLDHYRGMLDRKDKVMETEATLQYVEYGVLMATPEVIAKPPAFFSK